MNPDEKLTALKKAYADIILNTAKEAAARIMASERKSVRLQHELNASKEQAVQMLLRLKKLSDSKIREAETNSLSKQQKIEELEAQLQEAEDIVKELRDELRVVEDELERVRQSHLNEKKPEAEDIVKELRDELRSAHNELERMRKDEKKQEVTSSATVYIEKSALDQINEAYNTYQDDTDGIGSHNIIEPISAPILDDIVKPNNAPIQEDNRLNDVALQGEVGHHENRFSPLGNSYISKPKLPSIILGSKGNEPYRNKRTQRIRAFEEKLMAGGLAFPDTTHEVKNNANGKENGNDEENNKKSGGGANRKKGDVQKVKSLKRKRVTKDRKNSIPSSEKDQAFEGDRISDISHIEINSDNKDVELDENPLELLSRLSEDIHNERRLLKCTKVSENEVLPETDVEKADVAVECSMDVIAGTDCELLKQPATFKYTFQRRKKLGLSNSGTNDSVENKIEKDMEMEKQNDMIEMGMATLAESSRDSRRMAQVARQLISLSEKKWWK